METLDGTDWDVLIVGTGLKQSLLALALSRSDKKVLHIDQHSYYGGNQAALSLQEAEDWAVQHSSDEPRAFTEARVTKDDNATLAASRSYSLALAPELIFTRSTILPALVSSQTHGQLEFQAVGSWFVLEKHGLVKVPNGREDIFQDASLDIRAKRSYMKLIRFITDAEAQSALTDQELDTAIPDFLQQRFGIAPTAQAPLLALTLSAKSPRDCPVREVLPKIARHIQSIGLFGAGFNALTPKWGGLAEIAQVACRAGAVGGAVYCLGKGVRDLEHHGETSEVILSDGERIKTRTVVGPASELALPISTASTMSRFIGVVPSGLAQLFPPTSEGGVTPAGAVIRATASNGQPIHIYAHSSDSGECPVGQCVLYATILGDAVDQLQRGVSDFLTAIQEPQAVWSMSYKQHNIIAVSDEDEENIAVLNDMQPGLALEDDELDQIRSVWHRLTGDSINDFMKFTARDGTGDEEDDSLI